MARAMQPLPTGQSEAGATHPFATSGVLPTVLPGLVIRDVGPIGCPVSADDARRMIEQATQAPYGRGEATIVDTSVRRVWQLEPGQFALFNDEWKAHLAEIVAAVRQELGISSAVRAELYKLLVYEKGSFFAPHRDTEKVAGMFATLVICLPSRHKGGALIVRHDGRQTRINFGGADCESKTQYAAFYADCQHEVKPVTAGYRVCLVYNLVLGDKPPPKRKAAPAHGKAPSGVVEELKSLFATPGGALLKIAVPLIHQYTQEGLVPARLKGADRLRFDRLSRAAESLDCECYLALLTHHQSGEADYSTLSFDPFSSRRRRYWDDYGDSSQDEVNAEIGEVYEESLTLEHWIDARGRKPAFTSLSLQMNELVGGANREGWAVEQEVHEATGNEGVSMDRWYRKGVIVLWPRANLFGVLASEGPQTAVPALAQMVRRSRSESARSACRDFAEQIITHWRTRQSLLDTCQTGPLLRLLEQIGTVGQVQRCVTEILPTDLDGSEGETLGRLFEQFGWDVCVPAFVQFLKHETPSPRRVSLSSVVAICEAVCCGPPTMTEARQAACAAIAEELPKLLERWAGTRNDYRAHDSARPGSVLAGAARCLAALSAREALDRLVDHVIGRPNDHDIRTTVIPAVTMLYRRGGIAPAGRPAAERLLQHCAATLRSATAESIQPPSDERREARLGCSCADCQALARFLRDPNQHEARFPLKQSRRKHLQARIDACQCDVKHRVDPTGSPQSLVCVKTQRSYERRREQCAADLKLLAELEALAFAKDPAPVARGARRRAARR